VITLTQLAAGAGNTYWISFPQRYLIFLLAIAMPLSLIAITPVLVWDKTWQVLIAAKGLVKGLYTLLLLVLIGLLIFQMIKGTESGLGFLQPVELVKFLLVVLLAKLTLDMNEARQLIRDTSTSNMLKRFGQGLALALVFFVVVVGSVRDFSPILIVFGVGLAYLWLILRHPVNPRLKSLWAGRAVLLSLVVSIILFGWFLHQYPNLAFTLGIPQAERFMIWSNPFSYPDTGRQLQLSLQYAHEGGWLGTTWFGGNGKAMNLPAVQDDFILAFALYKFGGIAVITLLIAQLAWVGVIFSLLRQLLKQLPSPRDERLAQAMLAYILYGLAWMQLLHWLISWGNVLGLLPIMGQPMTWLSSANSHLLAIALPSVLLVLFASKKT
jgi:cell division protein FtsW (lipid II flippase)